MIRWFLSALVILAFSLAAPADPGRIIWLEQNLGRGVQLKTLEDAYVNYVQELHRQGQCSKAGVYLERLAILNKSRAATFS